MADYRMMSGIALCTAALLGCKLVDKLRGNDGDGADQPAGASGKTQGAAGEPTAKKTISECPPTLEGRETDINRVIGAECGSVKVTGDYYLDGGVLTLKAGATLAFAPNTKLVVGYYENAKLVAEGTKEKPVTLTASGDRVAGSWQGVKLHRKAARSTLTHTRIEYAGGEKGALYVAAEDVSVTHSTLSHVKGPAIEVANGGSLAALENNQLAELDGAALSVPPSAAGAIASSNQFPAGSEVLVEGGKLDHDATWQGLSIPYVLLKRVNVDGKDGARATLTLAAGAKLGFAPEGRLVIGYYQPGRLEVGGKPDQRVLFSSRKAREPGAWQGVEVHSKGEATIRHARFEYGGDDDEHGVLYAANESKVSVEGSEFATNELGLVGHQGAELESFAGNTFEDTPVAMQIGAAGLAALAADNTYQDEPRIVVEGGKVTADARWRPQSGARIEVKKTIKIDDATLTVEPGCVLAFEEGAALNVGYYQAAALKVQGTADKPVKLVGMRDETGSWKGVHLYSKARGNVLRELVVQNAGGEAGVVLHGKAKAEVKGLSCGKCEGAALKWDCKSELEHESVTAAGGTPQAEAAPSCR